ncbi:hypothetical protein PsorP6_008780 [Peronosclerospora sorghi]|uniref:Uncharacterized protein n=1 Tax=Peronosclerospora sorghi TaxID=230839 RepID=A0ACC0VYD3_9STRA|nr:hypothetical protein PsorP6_008780 [Peronosclerospora sorghi]
MLSCQVEHVTRIAEGRLETNNLLETELEQVRMQAANFKHMPKFYGAAQWAPKLIILQILSLQLFNVGFCMVQIFAIQQCSHYVAQGLILGICHGAHVTLDQFFAYHTQTITTVNGLKNCFAIIATSFVSALCLMLFVERAKKCLDFGVTLYFIDFLVQCFYSVRPLLLANEMEFPKMWDWWLVHLVALCVTVLLGEYLCSRRELEEIPMMGLFTKHTSRKN